MRRAPCGYCATRALPVAVPEILRSHTLTEFRPLSLLIAPLTPPPAAVANVPVPTYADGRELLVFRPFWQSVSVSKRVFRHAEAVPSSLSAVLLFPFSAELLGLVLILILVLVLIMILLILVLVLVLLILVLITVFHHSNPPTTSIAAFRESSMPEASPNIPLFCKSDFMYDAILQAVGKKCLQFLKSVL